MNKILIIGQAPPAVNQKVPYDTTMLYEILSWVGIGKEQAQDMFEFEAVSNIFPGHSNNGHLKPSLKKMDDHWNKTLRDKVWMASKIIVLGNVARDYLKTKTTKQMYYFTHPSRRNYSRIMENKEIISVQLKKIID